MPAPGQVGFHLTDNAIAGIAGLDGGHFIGPIGRMGDLLKMARLEEPDAFHKELIEVGCEDGEELDPIEQWG